VAGHEFLNAYAAHRAARGDTGTVAVGWTDWLEAGMWADAQRRLAGRWTVEAGAGGIGPDTDLLRGITGAEGIELVRRVLRFRPAAHTVISTQDLDLMLALHRSFTPAAHLQMLDRLRLSGPGHGRRTLPTPYRAPKTAAERAVTLLLESLLGIAGVGVDDDFFALGGDSLLALRLLSRLRDELGVEHPITAFLADPTVRALAVAFDEAPPAAGVPADVPTGVPADRQEVWL
jgi:nonribosomal peptide synthetase protein BlmVIII